MNPPQTATASRARLLRRLARLTAVLMLAVVSLSAYLRHQGAGVGCQPWPACFGTIAAADATVSASEAAARLAHRITASTALLLVIAMVVVSVARRPTLPSQARGSVVLLALALGLAVLGLQTTGSRLPAVVLGNLLGGFAMLALAVRLAKDLDSPEPPALGALLTLSLVALLSHLAVGALASANYAVATCDGIVVCGEQAAAGGWDFSALNPWQVLPAAPAAAAATVHFLHSAGSIAVSLLLLALIARCWRVRRRGAALALFMMLALQIALGASINLFGLSLGLVLFHNAGAALLLALLVKLR